MKKSSKTLLTMLSAAVIVAVTAFGTIAYFNDTDSDVNTFTVGRVNLELDEADVDENGVIENDGKRVKGNEYHLIPGQTYVKDPTVTVKANSADAYVRMLVYVERIDQLKKALPQFDSKGQAIEANQKYYNDELFLIQMLCNGWDSDTWKYEDYEEVTVAGKTTGIYEFRYVANEKDTEGNTLESEVVVANSEATKLPALFESITVPGEIDNEHLAFLNDVQIVVKAHAIQADGFDSAALAWNSAADLFKN